VLRRRYWPAPCDDVGCSATSIILIEVLIDIVDAYSGVNRAQERPNARG
jgi:hypothetical protein